MRWVITGANRGIGLELARQLLARGEQVDAAVRSPDTAGKLKELAKTHGERLRVHECDVSSDSSVRALGKALAGEAVDVLVNNAGVGFEDESLERLAFGEVLDAFNVNAVGPLRMVQALLPALRRGQAKKLVHITSGMASIGDNGSGGYYAYRLSKAALNMAARNLAVDLGGEGFVSVALHPGWVQTDMGGRGAPTPVEDSVEKMLKVIDGLGPKDNGKFLGYRGNEVTW